MFPSFALTPDADHVLALLPTTAAGRARNRLTVLVNFLAHVRHPADTRQASGAE